MDGDFRLCIKEIGNNTLRTSRQNKTISNHNTRILDISERIDVLEENDSFNVLKRRIDMVEQREEENAQSLKRLKSVGTLSEEHVAVLNTLKKKHKDVENGSDAISLIKLLIFDNEKHQQECIATMANQNQKIALLKESRNTWVSQYQERLNSIRDNQRIEFDKLRQNIVNAIRKNVCESHKQNVIGAMLKILENMSMLSFRII